MSDNYTKVGFISGLPIHNGDKIVIFLVKRNPRANVYAGAVSADDYFIPVFLPIYAIFDSYEIAKDIEKDHNTAMIEEYFGMPISNLIDSIDARATGTFDSSSNLLPTANEKLFNELTYCIESETVYAFMAQTKRPSYALSGIGNYWLRALGWRKSGKSNDPNKPVIFEHSALSQCKIITDGNDSVIVGNDLKEIKGIKVYTPKDLHQFMKDLHVITNISTKQTQECIADIAYDIYTNSVLMSSFVDRKTSVDRVLEATRRMAMETDYYIDGINTMASLVSTTQTFLLRKIFEFARNSEKNKPMRKQITDFLRFSWSMEDICAAYRPSNFGGKSFNEEYKIELLTLCRAMMRRRQLVTEAI